MHTQSYNIFKIQKKGKSQLLTKLNSLKKSSYYLTLKHSLKSTQKKTNPATIIKNKPFQTNLIVKKGVNTEFI